MKENTLSYTTRIGKTTFIVNVKQSESAKKPLNTVFQEICRHEMLGDFSADKYLNLENLQNHLDKLVPDGPACLPCQHGPPPVGLPRPQGHRPLSGVGGRPPPLAGAAVSDVRHGRH